MAKGIPPTVCNFFVVLKSKLTQHDAALSKRERVRGRENIYRLGHFLEAANRVEKDVSRRAPNCNVPLDAEIAAEMRASLQHNFAAGFPPAKNVEKQMNAFLTTGKQPSLLGAAARRTRRR